MMRSFRPFLHASLLLLFILSTGCDRPAPETEAPQRPPALSAQPNTSAYAEPWWQERFASKCAELESAPPARILLVGDSILHYLETHGQVPYREKLLPLGVINFGFSSDRTEHCLWRVENAPLDRIRPDLAVVLIGTNNTIQRADPPEEVFAGIEQICATLRRKLPQTRILVLKILPKGRNPADPVLELDRAINSLLDTLPERIPNLVTADCSPPFLDPSGHVRRDRMPDYLHPNAPGYTPLIETILQNLP